MIKKNFKITFVSLCIVFCLFNRDSNPQLSPKQLEAFCSINTIRIVVNQAYGEANDVNLPFKVVVTRVFEKAGLNVINGEEISADASIKIQAIGIPIGAQYTSGYHYSGALLSGLITLEIQNMGAYKKYFWGCWTPPYSINARKYSTASSAPFDMAFKGKDSFISKLMEITGEIYGIKPLIAALQDQNADVRKYATITLGDLNDKIAIGPLCSAIKEEDSLWIQQEQIRALGKLKYPQSVTCLINILRDRAMKPIRGDAVMALGDIGYLAVEPIIAALENGDLENLRTGVLGGFGKEESIEAIAKIGKPVVYPLISALRHKKWFVRNKAVIALGKIKDPQATEPLIIALKNEVVGVRRNAAAALGEINDNRAVKPLIAALKDTDVQVRYEASKALGKLKDRCSVEPLIAVLKDTSKVVRSKAVEALGEIKDRRVIDPLIAAIKDDNRSIRSEATEALGKNK